MSKTPGHLLGLFSTTGYDYDALRLSRLHHTPAVSPLEKLSFGSLKSDISSAATNLKAKTIAYTSISSSWPIRCLG
jgi:hypothetical protein